MSRLGKIFLVLLVLLLALLGYWFYRSHSVVSVTNNLDTTSPSQQALLNETIKTLSKFIVLPQNDTPVLGQVTDPKALAGEPFFKDALVGDQVLIYPKAKEAILYRPSIGKIIQMETIPTPTQ